MDTDKSKGFDANFANSREFLIVKRRYVSVMGVVIYPLLYRFSRRSRGMTSAKWVTL